MTAAAVCQAGAPVELAEALRPSRCGGSGEEMPESCLEAMCLCGARFAAAEGVRTAKGWRLPVHEERGAR